MNKQRIIALLGRRDTPTDAVEEYCRYLGEALQAEDYDLRIERIPWEEHGWGAAMRELRRQAKGWKGMWVLVQYTALAWSARGFPMRFVRVLKTLRYAGACVTVVYHDVEPYGGTRVIDRLRRSVQLRAMRDALNQSEVAIFTVALDKITWLRQSVGRVYFIPVGANLPVSHDTVSLKKLSAGAKLSIAVFGVTGGAAGKREIDNIAEAVRFAVSQVEELRLIVLGRHSNDAQSELKKQLGGTAVELHVLGVLPAEDVARTLCISDVLLFVRGPISTRRGSAIAGIACGLPVVAFSGTETAPRLPKRGWRFTLRRGKVTWGTCCFVCLRMSTIAHPWRNKAGSHKPSIFRGAQLAHVMPSSCANRSRQRICSCEVKCPKTFTILLPGR